MVSRLSTVEKDLDSTQPWGWISPSALSLTLDSPPDIAFTIRHEPETNSRILQLNSIASSCKVESFLQLIRTHLPELSIQKPVSFFIDWSGLTKESVTNLRKLLMDIIVLNYPLVWLSRLHNNHSDEPFDQIVAVLYRSWVKTSNGLFSTNITDMVTAQLTNIISTLISRYSGSLEAAFWRAPRTLASNYKSTSLSLWSPQMAGVDRRTIEDQFREPFKDKARIFGRAQSRLLRQKDFCDSLKFLIQSNSSNPNSVFNWLSFDDLSDEEEQRVLSQGLSIVLSYVNLGIWFAQLAAVESEKRNENVIYTQYLASFHARMMAESGWSDLDTTSFESYIQQLWFSYNEIRQKYAQTTIDYNGNRLELIVNDELNPLVLKFRKQGLIPDDRLGADIKFFLNQVKIWTDYFGPFIDLERDFQQAQQIIDVVNWDTQNRLDVRVLFETYKWFYAPLAFYRMTSGRSGLFWYIDVKWMAQRNLSSALQIIDSIVNGGAPISEIIYSGSEETKGLIEIAQKFSDILPHVQIAVGWDELLCYIPWQEQILSRMEDFVLQVSDLFTQRGFSCRMISAYTRDSGDASVLFSDLAKQSHFIKAIENKIELMCHINGLTVPSIVIENPEKINLSSKEYILSQILPNYSESINALITSTVGGVELDLGDSIIIRLEKRSGTHTIYCTITK